MGRRAKQAHSPWSDWLTCQSLEWTAAQRTGQLGPTACRANWAWPGEAGTKASGNMQTPIAPSLAYTVPNDQRCELFPGSRPGTIFDGGFRLRKRPIGIDQ
jgi:hypothetical protein